jgi:hypothetical protein
MFAFAFFVAGLCMITAGVWLVSESAGLIVGGGFLAVCAFVYERSGP